MSSASNSAIKHVGFAQLPDAAYVRLSSLVGPNGILPIGKATLWHWVKIGLFPKPVKLGHRISAWRVGDVRETLALMEKGA